MATATFAQDVLDNLLPMLYNEQDAPGDLTTYVTAASRPFELIESWASDTPTAVGWSLLVDVDRCPDEALAWLAQLVGMRLDNAVSTNDQRTQIRNLQNWRRGTPLAMTSVAAPYLTDSKTVLFRERFDGTNVDAPYNLEVVTYTDETPDPTIVEAAIRTQKPAGIILDYQLNDGQDYQSLKDNYATYALVKAAYTTYEGVRADEPGT